MQLGTAVTAVQTEGGFDTQSTATPDAVIRGWIHAVLQDGVGRAKWLKAMRRAPIVAGDGLIALGDDVVEVLRLRTIAADGSKSRPWLPTSTEKLWEYEGGGARYEGPSRTGVFAPNYSVTAAGVPGVESVQAAPAPSVGGGEWELHCVVLPAVIDASTSTSTVLPVPEDLVRPLVIDGAIGYGMRIAFGRHNDAVQYDGRFEAAVIELTKRAGGRIGSGPIRLARITRPRG